MIYLLLKNVPDEKSFDNLFHLLQMSDIEKKV